MNKTMQESYDTHKVRTLTYRGYRIILTINQFNDTIDITVNNAFNGHIMRISREIVVQLSRTNLLILMKARVDDYIDHPLP